MDWDYFCEVNFSELNNDSKEELCNQFSDCKVDPEATDDELKSVLILAKRLLQFRGGQVEDVKNESAAKIEKLRQENEELESQATSSKRARKASEAVRLQKENKDLLAELDMLKKKHKGKDPMLDTEEDDYRAERDKQKMKKTVELQTEHIASLLSDLEGAEAENASLKQHMSKLRDKLAEATESLAETTAELKNSHKASNQLKNRHSESRDEIESLRRQISELVDQRAILDSQLNQFQKAMESRVETWKGVMDKKDAEIAQMKQQVLFSTPEQYAHLQDTVSFLTQTLAIRDQQVNELTTRLAEATKDLEESTAALEKLRNNKGDGESRKLWQQLQRAVTRERALEARIEETEKDALVRGEQVTELSTQLQKLEKGEFGLPEALAEARELKRSLAVRDADIVRLIKTTNQLQTSLDELSDQNLALRERFGVTEEEIDVSGVKERRASERQIIESLLKQVANLEQEKVTLKLQLRELKKGKLIAESEEESAPKESEQVDVTLIIEENESLRKGMHEILESIRTQDAESDVHLESSCLERLLEALDARHVAGWYHPAMRLQAQLHTVQGAASELREQLRIAREQEKMWRDQISAGGIFRAEEVDSSRPLTIKRRTEISSRKPLDSEWSQKVRGTAKEVAKLFKEVSKSVPLLANAGREEEEKLNNKISDLESSIEEYKSHLEKEHSVAVCAAKCATQRIAERSALRKCHGLEAARKRLSLHLEEKALEAIGKEAKLSHEIANLKTKEIDLRNEIVKLEDLLNTCVPQEEFKSTQQELLKTSERLRELLLNKTKGTDESKETSQLKEEISNNELKIAYLVEDLQKEKSKLRVLEMQAHYPDAEQQVIALGQKLGALEVSEATANKRVEHAEKLYKLAKEQVIELENEKREIEAILLQNLSVAATELPVFDQKQPAQHVESGKIEGLEFSLAAAHRQIESLQNLANNRNLEMEAVRELNQQLQSSGDLQATLGRLTEDILSLRLDAEHSKFKLAEAEKALNAQKNKCEKLEKSLSVAQKQKTQISVEIHQRERILKKKLASICSRHTACVPISTFSLISGWLEDARKKADQFQITCSELKTKLEEVEKALEEEKLENSASSALAEVLKADSKDLQKQQIQEWHSRNLQLRIKDLESSRKAEKLEKECEEMKCQIINLKNHSRSLEDERLDLEKKWEQRLMALELERCLGEEISISKPSESKPKEAEMIVEEIDDENQEETKSVHPRKKLVRRGTFTLLQENPDVLKKELESKAEKICYLEKMLDGQHGDSRAKLALEAMVASLSELVSLKESAVLRARQRLKETNDEHSEVTKEMRRQIADLNTSLAKLQGAKVSESPDTSPGPAVTRLLTQVHTLEDELRVSNHSAATLAGQLRTVSSEMQRWKDLAEARQSKLQSLQDRYEDEISQAIATKLSSTRISEKADTEISEKEMPSFRSHQELLKSQQEVENLREIITRMQEQIKKLNSKVKEKIQIIKDAAESPQKQVEKTQPRLDNSKAAGIIGRLQGQVKSLQEEIDALKTKEQIFLDQNKAKTGEVVARWEERKRLQGKCSKLKIKLEESEANAKKLKESNLALRTLIERLEREKILLDQQLRRKTKAPPEPQRSTPADVQLAKARTKLASAEEEGASLRRQVEHYKRVADDVPRLRAESAAFRATFDKQREAAAQMQSKIARLEAANLQLNLKIDDLADAASIREREDLSDDGAMSRDELQRSVIVLGQHVRRLQAKLRAAKTSTMDSSGDSLGGETSQTLQVETRRRLSLENEVSQLRRERSELCAQLNQKVKILVEVRAALQEASLKESALKSEIASLRKSSHK